MAGISLRAEVLVKVMIAWMVTMTFAMAICMATSPMNVTDDAQDPADYCSNDVKDGTGDDTHGAAAVQSHDEVGPASKDVEGAAPGLRSVLAAAP